MKAKNCCFTCTNWCSSYDGRFKVRMCRKKGTQTKSTELCPMYRRDINLVTQIREYMQDSNYHKILKKYVEE